MMARQIIHGISSRKNHERNDRIKGVRFSRNFGHHSAISAGLDHAKGDFIVYMDSDLNLNRKMFLNFWKNF